MHDRRTSAWVSSTIASKPCRRGLQYLYRNVCVLILCVCADHAYISVGLTDRLLQSLEDVPFSIRVEVSVWCHDHKKYGKLSECDSYSAKIDLNGGYASNSVSPLYAGGDPMHTPVRYIGVVQSVA